MLSKEIEMQNYLIEHIKSHISTWDKSDIYVVSLFVYDEGDDPKHPTVTLGFNTNAQVKADINHWFSEVESKWNYACWLQNNKWYFGSDESRGIVEDWMEEKGLDQIEGEDYFDEKYQQITKAFVQVLIAVVQELHHSGFIKEQFGKEIPVLIHELEYYDEIACQNKLANPNVPLDEFEQFCLGLIE